MPPSQDWTTGPAKWAAVIVLGSASISGLAWSMLTRAPRATPSLAAAPPPAPAELSASSASEPLPAAPALSASAVRRININTATSTQLQLLPGIGPALAGRIMEYRSKNGPFRSIEELDNVKGIGARTLEKLRPLVSID